MTDARITQLAKESLVQADPTARVTQEVLQNLVQNDPPARVTQLVMQSLVKVKPPRPPGRATEFQTSTTSAAFTVEDPHWNKVAFLLNGSYGLRERSRHRLAGVGDRACGPYPDTTTSWRGTPLMCANRNTTGLLFYPPNRNHFALRNKPFTLEGWVNAPLVSAPRGIIGQYSAGSERSWGLLLDSNVFTFYGSSSGGAPDLILTGTTLVANTWTHFCVERDLTGKVRMYINGAMVSSATYAASFFLTSIPLSVMKHGWDTGVSSGWGLNGMVQDLRLTRGVARYGSDSGFTVPANPYPFVTFTPEAPTVDPHWDKVTCLINAQQDPVVELKRGATLTGITRVTNHNENSASNFSIVGPTGTVAHIDNQFDFGTRAEPFTLELDVNHGRGGNSGYDLFLVTGCLRVRVTRGGMFVQYWNGSAWLDMFAIGWRFSGPDPTSYVNTICVTRDEYGVWWCWRNGAYVGSAAHPPNMGSGAGVDAIIGGRSDGAARIDNIRVTWGVARYEYTGQGLEDTSWCYPYPLTGPAAPPAPVAVYPHEFPFPEPGPSVNGFWLADIGSAPTPVIFHEQRIDNGPTRNFYRWTSGVMTSNNRGMVGRRFPIPSQFWADVDAGLVFLDFEGEIGSALAADGGVLIARARPHLSGAATRMAVSERRSGQVMDVVSGRLGLPAGTRVVDLGFAGYRNATYTLNVALAQLKLRLVKEDPIKRIDLPAPVLADWVDAKGGTPVNLTGFDTLDLNVPSTTGKTADLRDVITLPVAFHDEIDAGQAAFAFEAMAFLSSGDPGDFGRTYIEFLDGSDAVVGRRKWDAHTPYYAPFPIYKIHLAAPIPPTARKAVIGIFQSKDYSEAAGTGNGNFHVNVTQAYAYIPDPLDMPAAAPTPPNPTFDEHWDKVRCLISTRNGSIQNLAPVDTRRIQVNGNIVVASINSPFGTTAMSSNLAGASIGTDWLEVELYGPDIGPVMTVEGWFMKTARSARQWEGIHNQLGSGADQPANPMRMDGAARSDAHLAFNEWYHVAICRNADGRGRVFVNGKRQATESNIPGLLWNRLFRLFVYDAASSAQSSWCGYIDEFRITEGVERYTADFVPQETRFPTTGPAASLLLSGDTGDLLLTGDTGSILLSGDDYGG